MKEKYYEWCATHAMTAKAATIAALGLAGFDSLDSTLRFFLLIAQIATTLCALALSVSALIGKAKKKKRSQTAYELKQKGHKHETTTDN